MWNRRVFAGNAAVASMAALVAALPALVGCAGTASGVTAACHAKTHPWVDTAPEPKGGKVYGIGVADSSREAVKRAQGQAAETVRVYVKGLTEALVVTDGSKRRAVAREYLSTFVNQSLEGCRLLDRCTAAGSVHAEVVCDHPDQLPTQLEEASVELARVAPRNSKLAVVALAGGGDMATEASARLHGHVVNACREARTCDVVARSSSRPEDGATHIVRLEIQKRPSGGLALITLEECNGPIAVYNKSLHLPTRTLTADAVDVPPLSVTDDTEVPSRAPGFGVGGSSLAVLALGGVFGGLAMSNYNRAKGLCPTHTGCSEEALSARSRAGTFATVSSVSVATGAAGLGLGIWLVLRIPSRSPTTGSSWRLQADLARGGMSLAGDF